MAAVALAHNPKRGGRGKGRPGRGGVGCMARECKDVCQGVKKPLLNRFKNCVKPCIAECGEGDRACKKSCRKEKCPFDDIEDTEGARECQACTKKCRPAFVQCSKDNCAEECPKLGVGKTRPCKMCLRKNCGPDPDDAEELAEAAEE